MSKKTVISFAGGVALGAYMMYNNLYRKVTKLIIDKDEAKTSEEENNENEEA